MMFGGMWTEVKGNGDKPQPRAEHGMCASDDGNRIYVFGGQIQNKAFNDFWQFDIPSSTWSQIEAPSAPAPRWGCTLTFYQNKIFLFGGEEVNAVDYQHLFVYDISKQTFYIYYVSR